MFVWLHPGENKTLNHKLSLLPPPLSNILSWMLIVSFQTHQLQYRQGRIQENRVYHCKSGNDIIRSLIEMFKFSDLTFAPRRLCNPKLLKVSSFHAVKTWEPELSKYFFQSENSGTLLISNSTVYIGDGTVPSKKMQRYPAFPECLRKYLSKLWVYIWLENINSVKSVKCKLK